MALKTWELFHSDKSKCFISISSLPDLNRNIKPILVQIISNLPLPNLSSNRMYVWEEFSCNFFIQFLFMPWPFTPSIIDSILRNSLLLCALLWGQRLGLTTEQHPLSVNTWWLSSTFNSGWPCAAFLNPFQSSPLWGVIWNPVIVFGAPQW